MFEKASRLKLRFNYKGLCPTEDLWYAPLFVSKEEKEMGEKGLKEIHQELYQELKKYRELRSIECDSIDEDGTESIKKTEEEEILELKIELEREEAVEKSKKKQELMEILYNQEKEQYKNMPREELLKIIDDL